MSGCLEIPTHVVTTDEVLFAVLILLHDEEQCPVYIHLPAHVNQLQTTSDNTRDTAYKPCTCTTIGAQNWDISQND